MLCSPPTIGGPYKLLCVSPLLQHQAQGRLADGLPRGSPGSGEEVGVVLRDEAGRHVSSLKLRVAGKSQQKVNVSVQSHDLRTEEAETVKSQSHDLFVGNLAFICCNTLVNCFHIFYTSTCVPSKEILHVSGKKIPSFCPDPFI